MSEIRRISVPYSHDGPWFVRREGVLLAQYLKQIDALQAAHRFASELQQGLIIPVIVMVQDGTGRWMPTIVPRRGARAAARISAVKFGKARANGLSRPTASSTNWLVLNLTPPQWSLLKRVAAVASFRLGDGDDIEMARHLQVIGLVESVATQFRLTRKGANALWYHRAH